jgi:hypothetical protein
MTWNKVFYLVPYHSLRGTVHVNVIDSVDRDKRQYPYSLPSIDTMPNLNCLPVSWQMWIAVIS